MSEQKSRQQSASHVSVPIDRYNELIAAEASNQELRAELADVTEQHAAAEIRAFRIDEQANAAIAAGEARATGLTQELDALKDIMRTDPESAHNLVRINREYASRCDAERQAAEARATAAEQALQEMRAQQQAERERLHAIIADCNGLIDPEQHPELNARIDAVLLPCDEAGRCVAAALRSTAQLEPDPLTVASLKSYAHEHGCTLEEAAERIVAGLRTQRAQGWQPIATAPKDGTIVDVWLGEADAEEAEFYCTPGTRRSCGWTYAGGRFRPAMGLRLAVTTVRPTHWMPLPAPPLSAPSTPEDR